MDVNILRLQTPTTEAEVAQKKKSIKSNTTKGDQINTGNNQVPYNYILWFYNPKKFLHVFRMLLVHFMTKCVIIQNKQVLKLVCLVLIFAIFFSFYFILFLRSLYLDSIL